VRILHLDSGIDWRGGQQQIHYLVTGLAQLGVVQQLVLREGSQLAHRIQETNVPRSTLPFVSELAPASVLRLKAIVKQFRPSLIHAHDSRTLGMAVVLKFLGERARLIAARRVAFPIRKNPLWRIKYQRKVDRIIAVSKFIRDQLLREGIASDKVEIIYDGYAFEAKESNGVRDRARKRFGFAEQDWVLGCIGQFTSEKGHEFLIRALKPLREKSRSVRLALVGDGPLRKRYETLVKELKLEPQVVLPGFVGDLHRVLPAFDLFVFPSLSEGLGSTLLTVMAHHVPVCASRAGGIPELVIEGETGFLFPPGDSDALAETVWRCAQDQAGTQRMADLAFRRVQKDFAVERMVSKTYEIYTNVLTE
jgi:glycosyltransferase involved in cell wall biosynthesis